MLKALVGYRTYIASVLACILAILIQADSSGIIHIAPMLRLVCDFLLVLIVPTIPIFLRKAIENTLNETAQKKNSDKK